MGLFCARPYEFTACASCRSPDLYPVAEQQAFAAQPHQSLLYGFLGSSQDFLTCAFLVTSKDKFYSRAEFSQMASTMGDGLEAVDLPTPAILKPFEMWTGKQLFSVLVRCGLAQGYRFCACCDVYLKLLVLTACLR